MATRSEQFRAQEQQRHARHHAKKPKPRRPPPKRKPSTGLRNPKGTARTARKATYAFEPTSREKRPSRRSTRASAHRIKADTNLNLREERQKGSPETRFRKARARRARVRGST